ncbi:AAC(3) family N-acetyltransferase [Halobacillus sp. ACCC02827]|uniref:aminoglycoside N(3)-acetyltransferase n=1 Tax=Halobacillus sp. ACCC02827 TaxID=3052090 RepID=UPI0025702009|nr:AAC(3) family N-acetyltransferase [Halobacillus sp. ACCC02827]WJE16245.1 AAC(3) family N-acetyltransferase [Halobacillus sp. ACCC02827]
MSEANAVQFSKQPQTRKSLAEDLRNLGVEEGMTVLVHSSMSSLGWVCGGPVTVIHALQDVLTPTGTLVMPAHSANMSDPAGWGNPPIPESWWETVRAEMPAFDPVITPSYFMGQIAEAFRSFPDVKRSNHPVSSFAAWGKYSEEITKDHSLDFGLGDQSPLARIYDRDGYVLLLGTDYESNTSMHLGEYRSKCLKECTNGSPVYEDGKRVWRTYKDLEYEEERFPTIGEAFEKVHQVKKAPVGEAEARLLPQPAVVDFTEAYLLHAHQ